MQRGASSRSFSRISGVYASRKRLQPCRDRKSGHFCEISGSLLCMVPAWYSDLSFRRRDTAVSMSSHDQPVDKTLNIDLSTFFTNCLDVVP